MERLFKEYKKRCLPCSFMVAEYLKIIVTILGVIALSLFSYLRCTIGIILSFVITLFIIAFIIWFTWLKNRNLRHRRLSKLAELLLEYKIDLSNTAQIDRLLDYIKEKKNRSTFLARFSTSILIVFSIIISAIGIDRETIFDFRQLLLFILIWIFHLD